MAVSGRRSRPVSGTGWIVPWGTRMLIGILIVFAILGASSNQSLFPSVGNGRKHINLDASC